MSENRPSQNRPQSAQRRDAMLHELTGAMRLFHARRRRRKRIAATFTLFAVLAGIAWIALLPPAQHQPPQIAQEERADATAIISRQPTRIEIVTTDPDIMRRYAAPDPPRLVMYIDDEQLLVMLDELDRPAGIVRMEHGVRLTAAVTDEELRDRSGEPRRINRAPPM